MEHTTQLSDTRRIKKTFLLEARHAASALQSIAPCSRFIYAFPRYEHSKVTELCKNHPSQEVIEHIFNILHFLYRYRPCVMANGRHSKHLLVVLC